MLFTMELYQLQEGAESAPQHPPAAQQSKAVLPSLCCSLFCRLGLAVLAFGGQHGGLQEVRVMGHPSRCQQHGCPKRHCPRACPSQSWLPTALLPRLVMLLCWCWHLPSLLSPPRFSIVTPVLCIEEGSVSCSFAILVALSLNLIFFFSTSIFWQCLLCPSAVLNVYFSLCTCLTKTALTQFLSE